jgi:hypothetical protein
MEISKDEPFNPILQGECVSADLQRRSSSKLNDWGPMLSYLTDTKKGKLRFVRNCFPHHGYVRARLFSTAIQELISPVISVPPVDLELRCLPASAFPVKLPP